MSRPQRGTLRDVRKGNRSVVLWTLYFANELSRHDLAQTTGLSAATVSNVIGDLVADGIVVETGSVDSDGGRPRIMLRVDPSYGYVVGMGVGETHVRVELYDLAMKERARKEFALDPSRHEPAVVARHILDGLEAVLSEAGADESEVLGMGLGVPGVAEQGPDLLIHARAFGWDGVPLGALLREGTSIPVFADNGVKTTGQAELWFGAGKGAQHLVMTFIGTGAGASVITGGVTYRGTANGAGEWGHTKIVLDGRPCRCGSRGCLEAYVGAEAILAGAGRGLGDDDEEGVFAALLADPLARPAFEEAVRCLGAGLANLINLVNPERVILGGWAGSLLGREFLSEIRAAAARYALPLPFSQASIELGRLGPEAVALGAATLVVEDFLLRSHAVRPAGRVATPAPAAGPAHA
ncbi:ROK family transcriptional regulator [Streptosporangium sp. NBC_01755]|uniref:ROK family transcriptional regulator n=1 Tax=unclassified Streptosporangium TaxID=2632669 RepID=UPI002DD9EF15|nr:MULTISPECIES: ROK family transcriptional regulator [unclassified Streptosporangium]WSA23559.1 ROK family transcriptional regulator [Streptosporangium sp. NBC_01810]WSC98231.1 ROK family transcriptional regulator [Streptosporangium sp. NBC_01755]